MSQPRADLARQRSFSPLGAERSRRPSSRRGSRSGSDTSQGLPAIAVMFLLSLLVPMTFWVGPLLLKPYRFLLLILFLPLLIRLFIGRAGKVMIIDWLLLGATFWSALALIVNHPFTLIIEPIGVQFIDFYGAYLVARTCIRCAEDFQRMARALFWIILLLLPFAFAESVTHQPVLMYLIGESQAAVDAGTRLGFRRTQAAFAHPIHYGTFVAAGLGLAWYALRPDASFWRRAACALVIALSTFFSLSTGALISFVMQCVFITWEAATRPSAKRWRVFAWGAVGAYFLIDVLSNRSPFHVLVDYASFNSGSAYNRILIWQYGTNNVSANPIFGIGLNEWQHPAWMSSSVDNFWLLLTMYYGLPFIVMFAGAVLVAVRRVSRQPLVDPLERACRAGYLTTLGGLVIAGGTVHYWHSLMSFALFMFGSGLWIVSGGALPGEPAAPGTRRHGRVPGQSRVRGDVVGLKHPRL